MDIEFIDAVREDERVVTVVTFKNTPGQRVYAVVNPPPGVAPRQLRNDVETTRIMLRDATGLKIATVHGDLRVEEVLQFKWPENHARWTRGILQRIGDCEITIEEEGGNVRTMALTGNDVGTRAWHNQRLREEFTVGDQIYYKIAAGDMIGVIRHPRPRITQFGIDVLAWRGLTADKVINVVTPEVTMFRREEINVDLTTDGWVVTGRSTLENPAIIEFTTRDGIMDFAAGGHKLSIGATGVTSWSGAYPETVQMGLVGRPLSTFVDLPFAHDDPLITEVKCSSSLGGSTSVDVDTPMRDMFRR